MRSKVSVIIPFYNSERSIERCARSLFEQTLHEIEYIFVDDGSTDNSIEILRGVINEYPQRQEQIMILTNGKNCGLAESRMKGMFASKGEYIISCDSDDQADKIMYECLYEYAKCGDYDYVWCDYYRTDGHNHNTIISQQCATDKMTIIRKLLTGISSGIIGSVWNRLFRRSILDNPLFVRSKGDMNEDLVTTIQFTLFSKRVGYLPRPLYYYYVSDDSICTTIDFDKVQKNLKGTILNNNFIMDILHFNGLSGKLAKEIECKKMSCKEVLIPVLDKKQARILWKDTYREINANIISNPYIPKGSKTRAFLILHNCYPLYKLFRMIYTAIK